METIKNAIIEKADLQIERGVLTGWIFLIYANGGQGFGGSALYLEKGFAHHDIKAAFAGHWIFRVMQIAGVESWNNLVGKTIRTKGGGVGSTLTAIGHIIKDDWFNPELDFKDL